MEMEFFPRFDVSRDGKSGNEFMFFFLMLWLAKMLIHSLILQHD